MAFADGGAAQGAGTSSRLAGGCRDNPAWANVTLESFWMSWPAPLMSPCSMTFLPTEKSQP